MRDWELHVTAKLPLSTWQRESQAQGENSALIPVMSPWSSDAIPSFDKYYDGFSCCNPCSPDSIILQRNITGRAHRLLNPQRGSYLSFVMFKKGLETFTKLSLVLHLLLSWSLSLWGLSSAPTCNFLFPSVSAVAINNNISSKYSWSAYYVQGALASLSFTVFIM